MKTGTIKFLGIATVLVAGGAWYAKSSRAAGTEASGRDGVALPKLQDSINDVGSVAVTTKDGTVTLERAADGWTLAERSGYAAKPEKVREVLFALRDARIVEAKTANKARFGKLGLNAPDAEDSNSKRIVVTSKSGEVLADALVGDRRFGKGGFGPGQTRSGEQTYMHPAGDGPALLVSGAFTADARAAGWLEAEFLDIQATRVKGARVTHADGETVAVGRGDMTASTLEIMDVPDGMETKVPDGTRAFVSSLSRLRFDDVRAADAIQFAGDSVATAEFFTEHGLRIVAETVELPKEGEEVADGAEPTMVTWARFSVDVVDPATIPGPPAPESMGPEAPPAEGEEPAAPAGPSADDLAREAAELNAALGPWAMALPSWKSGPFRMRQDGVLQPIPEPEPEPIEETPATAEEGTTQAPAAEPDSAGGNDVPPPAAEDPPGGDGGL